MCFYVVCPGLTLSRDVSGTIGTHNSAEARALAAAIQPASLQFLVAEQLAKFAQHSSVLAREQFVLCDQMLRV